jgi:hypothetical protein
MAATVIIPGESILIRPCQTTEDKPMPDTIESLEQQLEAMVESDPDAALDILRRELADISERQNKLHELKRRAEKKADEPDFIEDWKIAQRGHGMTLCWENLVYAEREWIIDFVSRLRIRIEHDLRTELQTEAVKQHFEKLEQATAASVDVEQLATRLANAVERCSNGSERIVIADILRTALQQPAQPQQSDPEPFSAELAALKSKWPESFSVSFINNFDGDWSIAVHRSGNDSVTGWCPTVTAAMQRLIPDYQQADAGKDEDEHDYHPGSDDCPTAKCLTSLLELVLDDKPMVFEDTPTRWSRALKRVQDLVRAARPLDVEQAVEAIWERFKDNGMMNVGGTLCGKARSLQVIANTLRECEGKAPAKPNDGR